MPGAPTRDGPPSPAVAGKHILVIEDDEDIRQMVATVLETSGASADKAGSGQDAQRLLADTAYDALVLDWNLPDMTGASFLTWLGREYADLVGTTLVITGRLTSSASPDRMGQPEVTVLAKPFRPRQLTSALAALFARA